MNKIIITKKESNSKKFKAIVDGKSHLWCGGNSEEEAVGDLIMSFPEEFQIKLESKLTKD